MSEMITKEELAQALRGLRVWGRKHTGSDEAQRVYILHPGDVANDIFISVNLHRPHPDALTAEQVAELRAALEKMGKRRD